MSLGIIEKDFKREHTEGQSNAYQKLTSSGQKLYEQIKTQSFPKDFFRIEIGGEGRKLTGGWKLSKNEVYYMEFVKGLQEHNPELYNLLKKIILNESPALQQLFIYLFHINRGGVVDKDQLMREFFKRDFVRKFIEEKGITVDPESLAQAEHRIPLLINFAQAFGFVEGYGQRMPLTVKKLPLANWLFGDQSESEENIIKRIKFVERYYESLNNDPEYDVAYMTKTKEDKGIVTYLRSKFGNSFLTPQYFAKEIDLI